MRQAFAHQAVIAMGPDADIRAPGAAVTAALCGHWEHEPPCPLAPHRCDAVRTGAEVHLEIVFAAEPVTESTVRERIDGALAGGRLRGPDGRTASWQLLSSAPRQVLAQERGLAERLASG
jgi:hypothetical protein